MFLKRLGGTQGIFRTLLPACTAYISLVTPDKAFVRDRGGTNHSGRHRSWRRSRRLGFQTLNTQFSQNDISGRAHSARCGDRCPPTVAGWRYRRSESRQNRSLRSAILCSLSTCDICRSHPLPFRRPRLMFSSSRQRHLRNLRGQTRRRLRGQSTIQPSIFSSRAPQMSNCI